MAGPVTTGTTQPGEQHDLAEMIPDAPPDKHQ